MSLARIISAHPEDVVSLVRELRNHGFLTEIVAPGEECAHPADVEVSVEAISSQSELARINELQGFEGEVLVAKGVLERMARKRIVPQETQPVIAGTAAPKAHEAVEAHGTDTASDPGVIESSPVSGTTPVVALEAELAAEPEHDSPAQTISASQQPALEATPPVERRPFLKPLLSSVGGKLGNGSRQGFVICRRGAWLLWRAGHSVGVGTARGVKASLPVVQKQAAGVLRSVSRATAGSQRALRESYVAALASWRMQRAMRKPRTAVRVEDAKTAISNLGPMETAAQVTQPAQLQEEVVLRRRDWEVAVVGAAIASCLIVIIFGITSRPIKAATAGSSHAIVTVPVSVPAAPPVASPAAESTRQAQAKVRETKVRPQPSDVSEADKADDVVVRRFNEQPKHQARQKTPGVTYYSDEQ